MRLEMEKGSSGSFLVSFAHSWGRLAELDGHTKVIPAPALRPGAE